MGKNRLSLAILMAIPLLGISAAPMSASAAIGVNISVGFAPPPLPVYVQPAIPAPGYLWMPGYWAWNGADYYWVPGTWVMPPRAGLLWTPPWWGWADGVYAWHAGYWGAHIGFYGGINYGFGYFGRGYEGGYWDHDRFFYNSTVNNIRNVNITNVYNKTVVVNQTVNRISFNGGSGGVSARPTGEERAALREPHVQPTVYQTQHLNAARGNTGLRASFNHGQPGITATSFAGRFNNGGNVAREPAGRREFSPPPPRGGEFRPAPVGENQGERREPPRRDEDREKREHRN